MNEQVCTPPGGKKEFHVVLIKPSHYDDDGYVIQWRRSSVPSNTLAVLYGLSRDLARRRILGEDVEIIISAYDETNTRIPVDNIIEQIQSAGGGGFVGFTGVQSNQFPRSMDMAARFVNAGVQACIGGFHVSGCLAMLKDLPEEIKRAMDMGVSLFAGEAESRLEELFRDAYAGALKPLYNYLDKMPAIDSQPGPFLPAEIIRRTMGSLASFDAGRGCPFKCSFCTIINVQGHKSRRRTADDVERIIRENLAQGIKRFAITDDNFARNQDWEAIFDRIINIQESEGTKIRLIIQADTMCHRIPGFIEKAGKAGVVNVFIGLESINPDNLQAAGKSQNKIAEYRKMLQAWQRAGTVTCAGYILGFPSDTPESIIKDIKTIQRELPIDILEFFFLTPLPGSEDHRNLLNSGTWMDPDLNNYDVTHVCTKHPKMSREEWESTYRSAWETYYTPEHIERILKRARASGKDTIQTMYLLLAFSTSFMLEGVHPLECGKFRHKYRLDRRPGLPLENPIIFYPKRLLEMASIRVRRLLRLWQFIRMRRRIMADPEANKYSDRASTPTEAGLDEYNSPSEALRPSD